MAMTKCAECSHEISTLADSCPHCGAPAAQVTNSQARTPEGPNPSLVASTEGVRLTWRHWLMVLVGVVVAVPLIDGLSEDGSHQMNAGARPGSSAAPEAPVLEKIDGHYYRRALERSQFAYRELDVGPNGAFTVNQRVLRVYRYLGRRQDLYAFSGTATATTATYFSCESPCEVVTVTTVDDARSESHQLLSPTKFGPLWALVQDAVGGELDKAIQEGGRVAQADRPPHGVLQRAPSPDDAASASE